MDGMFSFMRSKKTSESGVWENDEEIHDCPLCEVHFSVLIRKHHCRQCGRVVCRNCASNFKFLESSRSGTEKRICDGCFSQDRKTGGRPGDDDDEDEDDRDTARVQKAMAAVKVSSGGGGSGARATPSGEVQGRPPPATVSEVPQAEAIEALKVAKWTGKWKFALNFHSVDMGSKPVGMDAAASSFKKLSASTAVKAGSKISIVLDLKPKGAAYFQGECPEFAQFGKEGKVTGALQRSLGRVNMTLQIVSAVTKVTTSFNFVGAVNASGKFSGTFSGCEISKSAGTASGVFVATQEEEAPAEGGEAAAGEEDEEEAPKPTTKLSKSKSSSSVASPKRGKAKKAASDSDSD